MWIRTCTLKMLTVYSPETRLHCVLNSLLGVRPSPFGTPTAIGRIVPAPDGRRTVSIWWNEKAFPISTSFTTWCHLVSNPGNSDGKTSRLTTPVWHGRISPLKDRQNVVTGLDGRGFFFSRHGHKRLLSIACRPAVESTQIHVKFMPGDWGALRSKMAGAWSWQLASI
jgi:hypothetical protein